MSYLTVRFDFEDRLNPAPDFRLPSMQGDWLRISQLYAGGSLILMFLHAVEEPACRDFLSAIQSRLVDYQQRNARVAAILPHPVAEIPGANPEPALVLLADHDNTARQAYANLMVPELVHANDIMIFALDNHGGIYICLVSAEPDDDAQDELITWLDYISIQCPE
jgi:peroxiredoxin